MPELADVIEGLLREAGRGGSTHQACTCAQHALNLGFILADVAGKTAGSKYGELWGGMSDTERILASSAISVKDNCGVDVIGDIQEVIDSINELKPIVAEDGERAKQDAQMITKKVVTVAAGLFNRLRDCSLSPKMEAPDIEQPS